MLRWYRLTLLTVLLLAGASLQAAGNVQGKRFQDWGGNCDAQSSCYLQQVLSNSGQPLMVTLIGYAPGKPYPTVMLELPKGIHIQSGIQLQVDRNPPIKFGGSCDQHRCRAGFALDQRMYAQFQKGRRATVTFRPAPNKKPTRLPLSLMGLTAGLKALR